MSIRHDLIVYHLNHEIELTQREMKFIKWEKSLETIGEVSDRASRKKSWAEYSKHLCIRIWA